MIKTVVAASLLFASAFASEAVKFNVRAFEGIEGIPSNRLCLINGNPYRQGALQYSRADGSGMIIVDALSEERNGTCNMWMKNFDQPGKVEFYEKVGQLHAEFIEAALTADYDDQSAKILALHDKIKAFKAEAAGKVRANFYHCMTTSDIERLVYNAPASIVFMGQKLSVSKFANPKCHLPRRGGLRYFWDNLMSQITQIRNESVEPEQVENPSEYETCGQLSHLPLEILHRVVANLGTGLRVFSMTNRFLRHTCRHDMFYTIPELMPELFESLHVSHPLYTGYSLVRRVLENEHPISRNLPLVTRFDFVFKGAPRDYLYGYIDDQLSEKFRIEPEMEALILAALGRRMELWVRLCERLCTLSSLKGIMSLLGRVLGVDLLSAFNSLPANCIYEYCHKFAVDLIKRHLTEHAEQPVQQE